MNVTMVAGLAVSALLFACGLILVLMNMKKKKGKKSGIFAALLCIVALVFFVIFAFVSCNGEKDDDNSTNEQGPMYHYGEGPATKPTYTDNRKFLETRMGVTDDNADLVIYAEKYVNDMDDDAKNKDLKDNSCVEFDEDEIKKLLDGLDITHISRFRGNTLEGEDGNPWYTYVIACADKDAKNRAKKTLESNGYACQSETAKLTVATEGYDAISDVPVDDEGTRTYLTRADNGNLTAPVCLFDTGMGEEDKNGHGTLMCDVMHDFSDSVYIQSTRVFDENGEASASVLASSMLATEETCCVYNISASGEGTSPVLEHAVRSIVDGCKGVVVVAAGNDGKDAKNYTPANIEKAVTVGAYDKDADGIADYSNYGNCIDYICDGEYDGHFGTSIASARMSAYVSAILECNIPRTDVCRVLDKLSVKKNGYKYVNTTMDDISKACGEYKDELAEKTGIYADAMFDDCYNENGAVYNYYLDDENIGLIQPVSDKNGSITLKVSDIQTWKIHTLEIHNITTSIFDDYTVMGYVFTDANNHGYSISTVQNDGCKIGGKNGSSNIIDIKIDKRDVEYYPKCYGFPDNKEYVITSSGKKDHDPFALTQTFLWDEMYQKNDGETIIGHKLIKKGKDVEYPVKYNSENKDNITYRFPRLDVYHTVRVYTNAKVGGGNTTTPYVDIHQRPYHHTNNMYGAISAMYDRAFVAEGAQKPDAALQCVFDNVIFMSDAITDEKSLHAKNTGKDSFAWKKLYATKGIKGSGSTVKDNVFKPAVPKDRYELGRIADSYNSSTPSTKYGWVSNYRSDGQSFKGTTNDRFQGMHMYFGCGAISSHMYFTYKVRNLTYWLTWQKDEKWTDIKKTKTDNGKGDKVKSVDTVDICPILPITECLFSKYDYQTKTDGDIIPTQTMNPFTWDGKNGIRLGDSDDLFYGPQTLGSATNTIAGGKKRQKWMKEHDTFSLCDMDMKKNDGTSLKEKVETGMCYTRTKKLFDDIEGLYHIQGAFRYKVEIGPHTPHWFIGAAQTIVDDFDKNTVDIFNESALAMHKKTNSHTTSEFRIGDSKNCFIIKKGASVYMDVDDIGFMLSMCTNKLVAEFTLDGWKMKYSTANINKIMNNYISQFVAQSQKSIDAIQEGYDAMEEPPEKTAMEEWMERHDDKTPSEYWRDEFEEHFGQIRDKMKKYNDYWFKGKGKGKYALYGSNLDGGVQPEAYNNLVGAKVYLDADGGTAASSMEEANMGYYLTLADLDGVEVRSGETDSATVNLHGKVGNAKTASDETVDTSGESGSTLKDAIHINKTSELKRLAHVHNHYGAGTGGCQNKLNDSCKTGTTPDDKMDKVMFTTTLENVFEPIILPDAYRDGYIFDGWYKGDELIGFGGDKYIPEEIINGFFDPKSDDDPSGIDSTKKITVNLTAKWEPIKFRVAYVSNIPLDEDTSTNSATLQSHTVSPDKQLAPLDITKANSYRLGGPQSEYKASELMRARSDAASGGSESTDEDGDSFLDTDSEAIDRLNLSDTRYSASPDDKYYSYLGNKVYVYDGSDWDLENVDITVNDAYFTGWTYYDLLWDGTHTSYSEKKDLTPGTDGYWDINENISLNGHAREYYVDSGGDTHDTVSRVFYDDDGNCSIGESRNDVYDVNMDWSLKTLSMVKNPFANVMNNQPDKKYGTKNKTNSEHGDKTNNNTDDGNGVYLVLKANWDSTIDGDLNYTYHSNNDGEATKNKDFGSGTSLTNYQVIPDRNWFDDDRFGLPYSAFPAQGTAPNVATLRAEDIPGVTVTSFLSGKHALGDDDSYDGSAGSDTFVLHKDDRARYYFGQSNGRRGFFSRQGWSVWKFANWRDSIDSTKHDSGSSWARSNDYQPNGHDSHPTRYSTTTGNNGIPVATIYNDNDRLKRTGDLFYRYGVTTESQEQAYNGSSSNRNSGSDFMSGHSHSISQDIYTAYYWRWQQGKNGHYSEFINLIDNPSLHFYEIWDSYPVTDISNVYVYTEDGMNDDDDIATLTPAYLFSKVSAYDYEDLEKISGFGAAENRNIGRDRTWRNTCSANTNMDAKTPGDKTYSLAIEDNGPSYHGGTFTATLIGYNYDLFKEAKRTVLSGATNDVQSVALTWLFTDSAGNMTYHTSWVYIIDRTITDTDEGGGDDGTPDKSYNGGEGDTDDTRYAVTRFIDKKAYLSKSYTDPQGRGNTAGYSDSSHMTAGIPVNDSEAAGGVLNRSRWKLNSAYVTELTDALNRLETIGNARLTLNLHGFGGSDADGFMSTKNNGGLSFGYVDPATGAEHQYHPVRGTTSGILKKSTADEDRAETNYAGDTSVSDDRKHYQYGEVGGDRAWVYPWLNLKTQTKGLYQLDYNDILDTKCYVLNTGDDAISVKNGVGNYQSRDHSTLQRYIDSIFAATAVDGYRVR